MIIGIGTDILDLRRIKKIIDKYDQKFIDRIYGKKEIQIVQSKLNYSENYFGKRFAAKEATWKALSSCRGEGIFFKEIQIKDNFELADQFYNIHILSNYAIITLIVIHLTAVIIHRLFFKDNLLKKML